MFDRYGRAQGYGQMAPGRDLPVVDTPGQPGRPRNRVIQDAIGGMPVGGATFRGAQQTVGAAPGLQAPIDEPQKVDSPAGQPAPAQPSAINRLNFLEDPSAFRSLNPLKSPKDAWFEAAKSGKYSLQDIAGGKLLGDLQNDARPEVKNFYNGWAMAGKGDVLQFNGDKSTLAPEWGGYDSFDTIGKYDPEKGTGEIRWGVGEGRGGGGGQSQTMPSFISNAISNQQPMLDSGGGNYAERLRQQIMAALKVSPGLAPAAQQFGF